MVFQRVDRELRKVEIVLISYYRNGDFYKFLNQVINVWLKLCNCLFLAFHNMKLMDYMFAVMLRKSCVPEMHFGDIYISEVN